MNNKWWNAYLLFVGVFNVAVFFPHHQYFNLFLGVVFLVWFGVNVHHRKRSPKPNGVWYSAYCKDWWENHDQSRAHPGLFIEQTWITATPDWDRAWFISQNMSYPTL